MTAPRLIRFGRAVSDQLPDAAALLAIAAAALFVRALPWIWSVAHG